MTRDQVAILLETMTGQLKTTSSDNETQLQSARQRIATSLTRTKQADTGGRQLFINSDLYGPHRVTAASRQRITEIAERVITVTPPRQPEPEEQFFIRNTPVLNAQVAGSVPDWAIGAKPVQTFGPFINDDGREIWIDFYRIEKLVTLYAGNQPILLFKASFRQGRIIIPGGIPVEATTSYQVVAGSFWIHGRLLSAASPADRFAGVEVKKGTVTLNHPPSVQAGKLTVPAGTEIKISIELEQGKDDNASATSAYGKDARDAQYHLPDKWELTIRNNQAVITAIAQAHCTIFGQEVAFSFTPANNLAAEYNTGRILIPWQANADKFSVSASLSPWTVFSENAPLNKSYWALSAPVLNVDSPIQVAGNGAVALALGKGISTNWTALENGLTLLVNPLLVGQPGQIDLIDTMANLEGTSQRFTLWHEAAGKHPSTGKVFYKKKTVFLFGSISKGTEVISTMGEVTVDADRPVKVNGEPFRVHTMSCNVMLAASEEKRTVFLFEQEVEEKKPVVIPGVATPPPVVKRESIALENALFTVSPVAAFILYGEADASWKKITPANLFLSFFLYGYLPTLPDPYVGNVGRWRALFERLSSVQRQQSGFILICAVRYFPQADQFDNIDVSFHFGGQSMPNFTELPSGAPQNPPAPQPPPANNNDVAIIDPQVVAAFANPQAGATRASRLRTPEYERIWDDAWRLDSEYFSLLDVSSNANQLGISFGTNMAIIKTGNVRRVDGDVHTVAATQNNQFPFIVEGMQVKLPGQNVRAFTLPLVAWEPEINKTPPDRDDPNDPTSAKLPMDPEAGPMYYANDGGPGRFWSNNTALVPLAPIPVVNTLIEDYKTRPSNYTLAAVTLPFGMKAIAYISRGLDQSTDPSIKNIQPEFKVSDTGEPKYRGGIQLSLQSGNYGKKWSNPKENDSNMFPGYTLQLNNVLNFIGQPSGASNLGHRVTQIFNNEFLVAPLKTPQIDKSRGVPVTRMDITGYGANMFSNWLSPTAAMAQTSQARFDVMLGRTGHEVIQVKSILYPWGIRVVRTITVFRGPSGFVYRTDSGWKAESDGRFDFSYKYKEKIDDNGSESDDPDAPGYNYKEVTKTDQYQIHPGVIRGLYNVRNIKDAPSVTEFNSFNVIENNKLYLNGLKGKEEINTNPTFNEPVSCGGVYFDADIEIENMVQGNTGGTTEMDLGAGKKTKYGRVVSKRILGYVQTAPAGKPLSREQFRDLLLLQGGSIGAEVDCEVNIANSNQQMHINRVDVSASVAETGSDPVFVAAARGQVFLPKDGSWGMVQHNAATGEVTQLPNDVTVPLIRKGLLNLPTVINAQDARENLARIAHPMELLRAPAANTINFGFLQTTGSQKALFLTPAYGIDVPKLLSKTPPIFADAYRLMTGNSIFPNIGNAIDNFGKAMPMDKVYEGAAQVKAFVDSAFNDGAQKALEVMDVVAQKTADTVINQGMKMLQKKAGDAVDKALEFVVPQLSEPIYLVNSESLKIYIKYNAKPKADSEKKGKLDFDIDSFSGALDKQWRSRMNNLSMVVDLGDMKEIMTIKGNFDSKKGKESGYEGGPDDGTSDLPNPEIEFSDALKPVIDLLEILASLSTGDYAQTMKKGLKVAMSNSGEIWEYKFEANKDIPLVRFPPTDEAYNSAQCPLKLEASIGLGVYFNAALKVTTDPSQLLPTAGAFLKFHGGLSVMCVSVGVGSIYAVGSVDVRLAADTAVGPSLALKFGFGVQIVVSLPVVGNASVTYMIGVEMYADKTKVIVAALMLFRGQASLLGGLVCVTITIEAKGMIERELGSDETNCSAQVTFAIDISIFLVIDISFSKTWGEDRQIA